MGNAIFPTLPGLTWSVFTTPTWKTDVQQAVSGKEVRTAYRSRPIWRFSMSYEFLRGADARQEFQTLLAFFNARKGSFDSFLFSDPSDNHYTGHQFGVGDGVTRQFTLTHSIGGWTEPIGFSNNSVISVGGVLKSYPADYNSDGMSVTFTTAPGAGASLTATGDFYYRVRFDKDSSEFEEFMQNLWSLKKCELVGVI